MSLLNLAYQNVALYRSEMQSHYEQILKACNSMSDIRKRAEKESNLEESWLKALDPIVDILNERTERVQLKGKSFKSGIPATKQEVCDFEKNIHRLVDPDITLGKYTKNDLKQADGYKNFIDTHCRERNYIFQVRKCDQNTCCLPIRNPSGVVPPFLPDPEINPLDREHYKAFEDSLNTNTTERDMPSAQTASVSKVAEEQQGCPNRLLVAQNVRSTVRCEECDKPRCLYSKKSLSLRDERALQRLLEKYSYTCGSVITPDGDTLQGVIFVRLQLSCNSPVEVTYYSSSHVARKDICCYCAREQDVERDQEALKTHRVVLPICKSCRDADKPIIKRLPRKN